MYAYNFSKLDQREKKLYSIDDLKISSSGFPLRFVAMAAVLLAISAAINIPVCMSIGHWYCLPIDENVDFQTWGPLLCWGIPIGIAAVLYWCKISQYRLCDLIYLYLKPKRMISATGKVITYQKIKFDAFLER